MRRAIPGKERTMTGTLARMRLKISGGAALLALAAAMILAAQPVEAQVTTTGTLEAGKTNRCVLEQESSDAYLCVVTVPQTGVITLSAPNPSGALSHLVEGNAPRVDRNTRGITFQVSASVLGNANDAKVGKSTWTIRNTPASGQPVDYTVEVEVYASGTVPGGKTKGFSKDTTAPANSAPAAVLAPVLTGDAGG